MSVDHLPAVRCTTVALPAQPATVADPPHRVSGDLFLAASTGLLVAVSAGLTGQVTPAAFAGTACVAVAAAGWVERRRERPTVTARVVAPISAVAVIGVNGPGQRGGPTPTKHLRGVSLQPITAMTPTRAITAQ